MIGVGRRGCTPLSLSQQVVQGLEHRDRHGDRGAEQDQHEHEEAHRAAPVRALTMPLDLAPLGATPQTLAPLAILLDLLEEGLLDLRDALAHPHEIASLTAVP